MKNQAANNGTFIPKPGFTVVQNSVARDWNLSSGALGLYTRIQSYITMEKHYPHQRQPYGARAGGRIRLQHGMERIEKQGVFVHPCVSR